MAQLLNRIFLFILILSFQNIFSQIEKNVYNSDDYKDKKQFDKFMKRRKVIGGWQINQLKTGALVVKLKTGRTLINELYKAGNTEMANDKKLEMFIVNKNIMMAYRDNYNFGKVYFIYSSANDSLMSGARKGIFLDTNLTVDPTIEIKENFYLVAESDNIYNSSIGFIPEDSARKVKEHGNPSGQVVDIVVKNKYGHQLKKPFPYECGYGFGSTAYVIPGLKFIPVHYMITDSKIDYKIDKTQLIDYKNNPKKEFKKSPAGTKTFSLEKSNSYEVFSSKVTRFNDNLFYYYKGCPKPEMDKIDKEILPFLY